jgi:predicted DNA-binding antitoxin AbrB/MazE fold protein
MTTTIEAVFDGQVIRPDRPLNLPPNTRVTIVVTTPASSEEDDSFLETAMSLHLEGPPDWSGNLDKYLSESRLATNG